MTEAEWLSGGTLFHEFLRDARVEVSDRKLRLFLCACVRLVWPLLVDQTCRKAVETAESYADGLVPVKQLEGVWTHCWELGFLGVGGPADWAAHAAAEVSISPTGVRAGALKVCEAVAVESQRLLVAQRVGVEESADAERRVWQVQQYLFRDIVGNPFRPLALDPAWLAWNGGLVPKIAQAIYEERRFGDLPILGDALDDAGCDMADVLEHCHGPGAHVRGCWVIDLILDKV